MRYDTAGWGKRKTLMLKTFTAPEGPQAIDVAPTLSTNEGDHGRQRGGIREIWARLGTSTAVGGAAVLLLLIILYHRVAFKLVRDWLNLPDYSHGVLIPFFVLFLIWDKRHAFARTPIRPSWAGLIPLAVALLLLMVGVFGADLFLSRTSFVLLVAGIVWTLLGLRMLSEMKFVLFVMLLAIPFPALIFNHITFPLQLMASRLASALLPLAGVPVLREGNVIDLPAMRLEVAEACSGIRSLMSLFTVAVMGGYFLEAGTTRRTILALSSIPIAVAANAARIFGTGICVQYWDPSKAVGFFHEFSGWLMFLVSLGCLYVVYQVTQRLGRDKEKAA